MTDKLPNKIIGIDQIRINRGLEKDCKCSNRKFILDTTNRRVNCSSCGAIVEPYEALKDLAYNREGMQRQVETLLEQRKQILNYKPWLLTIRELERQYRGKEMLPNCPRCSTPFYLEEIKSWTGRKFADARIKQYEESKEKKPQ